MAINAHLDHLALGSPEPELLADFYVTSLKNTSHKLGEYFLVESSERKILITKGKPKELIFFGMSLSKDNLECLRKKLISKNISIEPSPSPLFDHTAFSVIDPDGNCCVFGTSEKPSGHQKELRARLQHFGFATTKLEIMISFYVDILGYNVSDNVFDDDGKLRATFLRSDYEHHSLAIFYAKENWFDHHCYEASNWNQLRDWADHFSTLDIPLKWGPGRHGPGNNLFLFIHDLDGNWLEISAELDTVKLNSAPGKWRHEDKTLNYWGQAFLRS